jgi:hypothetical protein
VVGSSGPDPRARGSDAVGSVNVTFERLVGRFLRYLKAHNYDKDESCCIRIMSLFRAHILKARSYSDGSVRDFGDLENNEQKIFKERQNTLNSWGVTSVVLHAISTHAANIEGNLADESVEVLKELLYGGNEAVQAKVGNFIRDIDKDNKFLLHMRQRMEHSHVAIKERKEKTSLR